MPYSTEFQLYTDLDWFFVDKFKRVCHAASAGGLLPESVTNNNENNDRFFQVVNRREETFKVGYNPGLDNILQQLQVTDKEQYLRSFTYMAARGIYSFDKFLIDDPIDKRYFLVAYPIYDSNDSHPFLEEELSLLPRTQVTIRKEYKKPISLTEYLRRENVLY